MRCSACGVDLAGVMAMGDYAWCGVEGRCIACCTDFVGHCSDVERFEQEAIDWLATVLAEAESTVTP
jgi:hypothetical protein